MSTYLESSVERMSDADHRRSNPLAAWQADIYAPADITSLQQELRMATAADVNAELQRFVSSYVRMARHYAPFPSIGIAVFSILETTEYLTDRTKGAYVAEVIRRLADWLDHENQVDPAPFDEAAGYAASILEQGES